MNRDPHIWQEGAGLVLHGMGANPFTVYAGYLGELEKISSAAGTALHEAGDSLAHAVESGRAAARSGEGAAQGGLLARLKKFLGLKGADAEAAVRDMSSADKAAVEKELAAQGAHDGNTLARPVSEGVVHAGDRTRAVARGEMTRPSSRTLVEAEEVNTKAQRLEQQVAHERANPDTEAMPLPEAPAQPPAPSSGAPARPSARVPEVTPTRAGMAREFGGFSREELALALKERAARGIDPGESLALTPAQLRSGQEVHVGRADPTWGHDVAGGAGDTIVPHRGMGIQQNLTPMGPPVPPLPPDALSMAPGGQRVPAAQAEVALGIKGDARLGAVDPAVDNRPAADALAHQTEMAHRAHAAAQARVEATGAHLQRTVQAPPTPANIGGWDPAQNPALDRGQKLAPAVRPARAPKQAPLPGEFAEPGAPKTGKTGKKKEDPASMTGALGMAGAGVGAGALGFAGAYGARRMTSNDNN